MFTRTRYQKCCFQKKTRADGKEIYWECRFYEQDAQGKRLRRSQTIGTLAAYPTESAARKSPMAQALLLRVNADHSHVGIAAPTMAQ